MTPSLINETYASMKLNRAGVIRLRDMVAKSDAPKKEQLLMLCEQAAPIADRMQAFAMGVLASGTVTTDEQIMLTIEREGPTISAALASMGEGMAMTDLLKAGLAAADQLGAWMQLATLLDHILHPDPERPRQRIRLRDEVNERRTRRG